MLGYLFKSQERRSVPMHGRKQNQSLACSFNDKILNHFEHFYYDKFQVSKWISFGRQFLKWHQQILIIHYNEFFSFFSNTMNLHQIHVSYLKLNNTWTMNFTFWKSFQGEKYFWKKHPPFDDFATDNPWNKRLWNLLCDT